jgi:hypothetical protein
MKKWLSIILVILFIGTGYVVYDTMQNNKEKEAELSALQAQIEDLNAQLSGEQLTGAIQLNQEITPEPTEEIVAPVATPTVVPTQTPVVQETTTTSTTPNTPPVTQTPSTPTVSPQSQFISSQDRTTSVCGYRKQDGLPSVAWGQAAKFINSKLQYVRDNWQQHTTTLMNEAYAALSDPTIDATEKCRQSWLIDELSNQKWFIRSYQTQNWITTIGIDFISLQDDISKIQWDGPPRLDLYKNSSTKVRYYTLSNNPNLQIAQTDLDGNIQNIWYRGLWLSSFDQRINSFCNYEPIYTDERRYEELYQNWVVVWSGYTELINWNDYGRYCIKDYLFNWYSTHGKTPIFQFNQHWQLHQIDTNHRVFSNAW